MLVQTTDHPDKPSRRCSPVVQRRWRLLGIRRDVLDAGDARRRTDAASFEAALQSLDGIGGHIEMDYELHPDRRYQKLDICFTAVIHLNQTDRSLTDAILRQLESAFSRQHVIARCRPKDPQKNMAHVAAIASTIDSACIEPVPGRFSAGQPLQVRSTIDWSMLLVALADLAEPVIIRFESVAAHTQSLHRQLDEVQRRWQMRQEIARRSGSNSRRPQTNGEVDRPRPRHRPEPLTIANRMPTTVLQSLVAMTASARHLDIRVSGNDPGTVLCIAGIVQDAVYEPGTARVGLAGPPKENLAVQGATHKATPSNDLLSMAGTMCAQDGVSRVLAGPRLDSPLMYPVAGSGAIQSGQDKLIIGHHFDEQVECETNLPIGMPYGDLCRHALFSGETGSGKTGTIFQTIAGAACCDPPIPVCYIALAKDEGTALLGWRKSLNPCLKAYAQQMVFCGLHPKAPLRVHINPFALEDADDNERAEHAHHVLKSAISLEGPLAGNTMEACADLCHDAQQHGVMPVLADLPNAVRIVQAEKGYSADVQGDIGGAFESRINTLINGLHGELFRSPMSSPTVSQLMAAPHYIACGKVLREIKAMFVIDLLLRLEHWLGENSPPGTGDPKRPRLIVIVDEVQVIAPRDPRPAGGDQPIASIEAATTLAHCVKTLRDHRVAFLAASQHPLSIDAELVKAPGTHLVLTQKQVDEREELAGLIGLDARQRDQLNGLETGHGFFRAPGMKRPQRIVVPHIAGIHDCPTLDDADVAVYCSKSSHQRALAITQCEAELSMREVRLVQMLVRLRRDRQRLRDLQHALDLAHSDTAHPNTARQLMVEIRKTAARIDRDLGFRGRPYQRQWIRTLAPLPAWLTGWADGARRLVKHKKQIDTLRCRQRRLERAYERWMGRHQSAVEHAVALVAG